MQSAQIDYHNTTNTFHFSYLQRVDKDMFQRHLHEAYEIFYLFSGERRFFLSNQRYLLQAGDLVLIKPDILHKGIHSSVPGCERMVVHFQKNYLPVNSEIFSELSFLFEQEFTLLRLPINHRDTFEALFREMLKEAASKAIGIAPYMQSILVQLLIRIGRQTAKNNNSFEPNDPISVGVYQIIQYINGNFQEEITIPILCRNFYISASYLSKIFKEVTGFTLVEYINSVRIKEAIKLLTGSKLKVIQIAAAVGFGSISHFGRVFTEITGHAPLYYRIQDREENQHTSKARYKKIKKP